MFIGLSSASAPGAVREGRVKCRTLYGAVRMGLFRIGLFAHRRGPAHCSVIPAGISFRAHLPKEESMRWIPVWMVALVLSCGGTQRSTEEEQHERRLAAACGPDPAADADRSGEWHEELGCRYSAEERKVCEGWPDPTSAMRRPMFCAGEPTSAMCGRRRERRLTETNLLRCICQTDQQHADRLDYCDNAP